MSEILWEFVTPINFMGGGGRTSFRKGNAKGQRSSTNHLVYPPLGSFSQFHPKLIKPPREENFNNCFGLLSQSLCPLLIKMSISKVFATL